MNETLHAIEELPGLAGNLSAAMADANKALLREGWSRILDRRLPFSDALILGPVKINLRFWISKEGEKRILFFFREQTFEVVIDAETEMNLTLAPRSTGPAPRGSGETGYLLEIPPFIEPVQSQPQLGRWTNLITRPKPTPENTVIFKIGPDSRSVLAVVLGGMNRRNPTARFQYTPPSGGTRLLDKNADAWTLMIFLDLTRAIADWFSEKKTVSRILPLTLPREADQGDVSKILRILASAYREANWSLNAFNRAHPEGSLLDRLLPGLRTESFTARFILRLNALGKISTSNKDQTFHLNIDARAVLDETGTRFQVALGVPDFLVGSELGLVLLSPFKEGIGFEELLAKTIETLKRHPKSGSEQTFSPSMLREFLDLSGEQAIIFRTNREKVKSVKKSTNIFILKGRFAGEIRTLIFQAVLKSEEQLRIGAPRELARGTVKIMFFGTPEKNSRGLDPEAFQYLARLARVFCQWMGVLP